MDPLFLTVAGQRLEYAWWGPRPGAGPTLVFLHEGLGCLDLWRDFPRQLSEATGLGAFAYSRLGYGRSDPVQLPRPLSYMHDEAALLREVFGAAGVTEPLLIGHSDGASIAIIYSGSETRPPVRALILEAPHLFAEEFGLNTITRMADEFRTTDLPKKLAREKPAVALKCKCLRPAGIPHIAISPERCWNRWAASCDGSTRTQGTRCDTCGIQASASSGYSRWPNSDSRRARTRVSRVRRRCRSR